MKSAMGSDVVSHTYGSSSSRGNAKPKMRKRKLRDGYRGQEAAVSLKSKKHTNFLLILFEKCDIAAQKCLFPGVFQKEYFSSGHSTAGWSVHYLSKCFSTDLSLVINNRRRIFNITYSSVTPVAAKTPLNHPNSGPPQFGLQASL